MDTQEEKLKIDFEWKSNGGGGYYIMVVKYDSIFKIEIYCIDYDEEYYNGFMKLINFNEQDLSLKYKDFIIHSDYDIFKIENDTIIINNDDRSEAAKIFELKYKPNNFKKFMEEFDYKFMKCINEFYNIDKKESHHDIVYELFYEDDNIEEAVNYINSLDNDVTKEHMLDTLRDVVFCKPYKNNEYWNRIIDNINKINNFENIKKNIINKIEAKLMNQPQPSCDYYPEDIHRKSLKERKQIRMAALKNSYKFNQCNSNKN